MGSRSQTFFALSYGKQVINRHISKIIETAGAHWCILVDARVLRTSFNKAMMNRVNLVNKKGNKQLPNSDEVL